MRRAGDQPAILIAGPTASGKSSLALKLAERLRGGVINADSMQVYRELAVLTARPTPDDQARIPHFLYGFVSGSEAYSAGRYARDAAEAIADVRSMGRVPIIVGGTGLYFSALLEGLSPVPAADPEVRNYWRAQGRVRSSQELHALLMQRDPVMATRLMPTDRQRVVRALEVLEGTGKSLADWQREPGRPVLAEPDVAKLLSVPDRTIHGAAIDDRFDAMVKAGAIDEVRHLMALGLAGDLPIMRALGVAPLAIAITGGSTYEDAIERAKRDTRQYAKRQRTWFKSKMIAWNEIYAQEMESIDRIIATFIEP